MKSVLLLIIAAVAFGAPRPQTQEPVAILKDERVDNGDGNFNYEFESADGTSVSAKGTPNADGGVNIEGAYKFTLPDGVVVEITYVADGEGFKPKGEILPTPHPLPEHAIEQIRFAEEQRAQGVTFD